MTAATPHDKLRWARIFAMLSLGLGLTAAAGAFSLLLQMFILSFTLVVLYLINRCFSVWIAREQHRARPSRMAAH